MTKNTLEMVNFVVLSGLAKSCGGLVDELLLDVILYTMEKLFLINAKAHRKVTSCKSNPQNEE